MKFKTSQILQTSRDFFNEVVYPILKAHFPDEIEVAACGFFGYGSECLGMDDELSRDHHFGLRVNMLMPEDVVSAKGEAMLQTLSDELPETYRGFSLRAGHEKGAGVAPESLDGFLTRTIGITHAPNTFAEWLNIPEEDIIHVINGEVWHDPSRAFSTIRAVLGDYYPDPVWKRRIAHWCRYFSGMGLYPMRRAVLRENWVYATTAFGRTMKWAMELAFMLNRIYFPYDKWLYPFFEALPEVAPEMNPLILEASSDSCSWERRIEIFERISDLLDAKMVELGLVPPHPHFRGSPTSGYRLLEHNYAAILKSLPTEILSIVPLWEQVYLEAFHSGYVAGLPIEEWDAVLNLTPI
jgi:hypothetical protein